MTSRHASVIQQRQSMYQAILHLEKEGLTVLDRDIAEDISLSADTCLLILTERATQVCPVASMSIYGTLKNAVQIASLFLYMAEFEEVCTTR